MTLPAPARKTGAHAKRGRHGRLGRISPALIVILAGVSAALHVGKLPPALPVLQEALGVTLVQAGFLLSLMQLAGMALGLAVGLAADGWGLKRSMATGLWVLAGAGALGGWARDPADLLVLRAVEGFGLLLATLPAPGLVRALVPPARTAAMLGLWGAYMPLGTATALLTGPLVMAAIGWPGWWWLLAALSGAMALWLGAAVPADAARLTADAPPAAATAATAPAAPPAVPTAAAAHPTPAERVTASAPEPASWPQRLRQTLRAPGPWLVALSFAVYSAQWIAVIGFLPSLYVQAGLSGGLVGVLTALAAAVNMVGNIASGRLLQSGVAPRSLLLAGFAAMGLGALLAFAGTAAGPSLPPALRYAAVLAFSMVGGLIPGTLFSLAVRLAPGEGTVSTTVGWMQQWSSIGQFAGPPLVAWLASRVGGWQWTWLVTGTCALVGAALALPIGRALRRQGG